MSRACSRPILNYSYLEHRQERAPAVPHGTPLLLLRTPPPPPPRLGRASATPCALGSQPSVVTLFYAPVAPRKQWAAVVHEAAPTVRAPL